MPVPGQEQHAGQPAGAGVPPRVRLRRGPGRLGGDRGWRAGFDGGAWERNAGTGAQVRGAPRPNFTRPAQSRRVRHGDQGGGRVLAARADGDQGGGCVRQPPARGMYGHHAGEQRRVAAGDVPRCSVAERRRSTGADFGG